MSDQGKGAVSETTSDNYTTGVSAYIHIQTDGLAETKHFESEHLEGVDAMSLKVMSVPS